MTTDTHTADIRYRVDYDPLSDLLKWLAFWLFLSSIGYCFSMAAVTYFTLLEYYPSQISTTNEWAVFALWSVKIHWPIIYDLVVLQKWSSVAKITYLAFAMATFIATFLAVVIYRTAVKRHRRILMAAGKLDLPIPHVKKGNRGMFAGTFNGQDLYSTIEDRALVVGPPGTGKTAFMLNQILRSARAKMSFVAVDIKPEIADILRDELTANGYEVIEFDPILGGTGYNPCLDIIDDQGINELVLSLIPTPDHDPIWVKAEQAYFRLALMYLRHRNPQKCSLPGAFQLLGHFPSPEAFLKTVKRSKNKIVKQQAEKILSQLDSSKPAQAGFSAVFDRLNWLSYDTTAQALTGHEFSLKQLGKEKPVALFLKFQETHMETMGSLLSALYSHILRSLIISSNDRGPVALFLDEIGNVPPIAGLVSKLNTIRSRHLPCWMYWQSTAQMDAYGNNAREVFFGAADMQLFFRSNDINTQETVEKLAGQVVVAQYSQSQVDGKTTNTTSTERIARVEGAKLGELGAGEVYCLYKGGRWRGTATPHYVDFSRYKR